MIITTNDLSNKVKVKIKYFQDIVYALNFVNTEGKLGVVCYNYGDNCWQPFCYHYSQQKYTFKAKTYQELLNNLPKFPRENIADIKAKFYNTFDTPLEINDRAFNISFEIVSSNLLLKRKTYYLISDVQELERSFNSNIIPCEIVGCDDIKAGNTKIKDESLIKIINDLLN